MYHGMYRQLVYCYVLFSFHFLFLLFCLFMRQSMLCTFSFVYLTAGVFLWLFLFYFVWNTNFLSPSVLIQLVGDSLCTSWRFSPPFFFFYFFLSPFFHSSPLPFLPYLADSPGSPSVRRRDQPLLCAYAATPPPHSISIKRSCWRRPTLYLLRKYHLHTYVTTYPILSISFLLFRLRPHFTHNDNGSHQMPIQVYQLAKGR